jgi:tripartite-type tricarboxylate transporter receptor subunit TctC
VTKVNAALGESLKSPSIQAHLAKFNVETNMTSPQEFAAFIAGEAEKWGGIIRSTGIKAE